MVKDEGTTETFRKDSGFHDSRSSSRMILAPLCSFPPSFPFSCLCIPQYNECFIQVTDPTNPGTPVVIEGPVAFAKNPCMHPGDVRFLTAVGGRWRTAALTHHRDVVILPQRGPRSHCSEASGSDLDGDIYFCSWHPGLVRNRVSDPPMDYHAQAKEDGPVTMQVRGVTIEERGVYGTVVVHQMVSFSSGIPAASYTW